MKVWVAIWITVYKEVDYYNYYNFDNDVHSLFIQGSNIFLLRGTIKKFEMLVSGVHIYYLAFYAVRIKS